MPDVDLTFGGDGSPVKRAWEMSAEGCAEFINEVKKIVGASNAADNAQKQLGSTADRWLKQMETPLDSHLRRIGELQTLLQAGKIRQDQYTLGIQMSGKEMRAAEAAADTLGQTAKRILADQQSPQEQFNAKLEQYTELRKANKLTEDQFALAVSRARAAMEAQDAGLQSLKRDAEKLRSSLVTPQNEYAAALQRANQLLQAEEISEAEYAAAVDKAKEALNAKDQALQKMLSHAKRIREDAVTPEEAHAKAIRLAKQALDQKLISQKEFDNELTKQNELLDKAQSKNKSFFDSALGKSGEVLATVTGIGTVIGGLAAVVGQLRAEYENLLERQKSAADRQLDTAAAQHGAIAALGNDATVSADQLTDRALQTSLATGVLPKTIFDAQQNALSSKAALAAEEALQAVEVAAEANPYSGISEISGSLLDLKNRFGGEGGKLSTTLKDLTMPQLMGVSLGGQQASRVKDPTAYATNSIPAITQLGAYKNDLQQSTALVAAMSTSMNDLSGATSGTAMLKLAAQLRIALPNIEGTMNQIEFLQSEAGAKLRKKLLTKGPGGLDTESGAKMAVEELLSPGENQTKNNLKAAMASVPTVDNSEQLYRDISARQKSQAIQKLAAVDRQLKVETEVTALRDASGAMSSVNREGLANYLKQMKASSIEQQMVMAQYDAATQLGNVDPLDFTIKALRDRANNYSVGTEYVGNYDESGRGESSFTQSDEDKRKASEYMATADRLTRLQRARRGVPVEEQPQPLPAAQPKPAVSETVAKDGISDLTAALKENTAATVANSKKPPFVLKRSATNPTKTPVSAALQTLLKDADKSWR